VIVWPDGGSPEPLRFPREFQGAGRHDNPAVYGCLYAAEAAASAIAEVLVPFRGAGPLSAAMLRRPSGRLALASLRLRRGGDLVDLDSPAELVRIRLRPSEVATRRRMATQAQAARLHQEEPGAGGLRWWSTLESSWLNVTIFDRAEPRLELVDVSLLEPDDEQVGDAAELLGLV
jgi:RES domain